MLATRKLLVVQALLSAIGCSSSAPVPVEAPSSGAAMVPRPPWLSLVAEQVVALEACVHARTPGPAFVVHVQYLNDQRVGLVTMGGDGTLERCVYRLDRVEYRSRMQEFRSSDFMGRPAIYPAEERPSWGVDAYLEEVISKGKTVAWVHWLGVEVAQ